MIRCPGAPIHFIQVNVPDDRQVLPDKFRADSVSAAVLWTSNMVRTAGLLICRTRAAAWSNRFTRLHRCGASGSIRIVIDRSRACGATEARPSRNRARASLIGTPGNARAVLRIQTRHSYSGRDRLRDR